MKITVFWDVTLYILVRYNQYTSEIFVPYIPEDYILHGKFKFILELGQLLFK
jgi:hypothetical protein